MDGVGQMNWSSEIAAAFPVIVRMDVIDSTIGRMSFDPSTECV